MVATAHAIALSAALGERRGAVATAVGQGDELTVFLAHHQDRFAQDGSSEKLG
jgi:hypothetical protein